MKVLVIGSGGREHALCWKLRQSKQVNALYCAPGNPGTEKLAKNLAIKVDDIPALVAAAREHQIDLTIVGPELPLSLGVVDAFQSAGLTVFGPSKAAAQLEASKNFAKEVMMRAGVPTARHETVTSEVGAREHLKKHGVPIVFKADGLASGKGVFVCMTESEADSALKALFGEFKASRVVIEQFLSGVEVSYIVATNGRDIVPFASSHDYKRIGDNDQGLNTGGMGSVSPTPRFNDKQGAWVIENVIRPVLQQMEKDGTPFSGFLYAGLMISSQGEINVIEFNARFGDPECQSIMRRLDSDLAELLLALAMNKPPPPLQWRSEVAVCLVAASAGYPSAPTSGDEISGIEYAEMLPEAVVFHAGTSRGKDGKLLTAGGRVLNITAIGSNLDEARNRAYKACDMIQFRGRQVRRDIGRS